MSSIPADIVADSSRLPCAETHFQCPSSGYCLPVYVRCNGVYDCPSHEDEHCGRYRCPGFYQCRGSKVCVHHQHVCDNFTQCPQGDDELLCGLACPDVCTCYGLAWFCARHFTTGATWQLHYVDAGGSGMTVEDFDGSTLLVHLELSYCDISMVSTVWFPSLRTLDIRDNKLTHFSSSFSMPNLRVLILSGNPLISPIADLEALNLDQLAVLSLSRLAIEEIHLSNTSTFRNLDTLNLSQSGVRRMTEAGLKPLTQLKVLDMRGCPLLSFPPDLFQSLDSLQSVFADNYRLCCPSVLPSGFRLSRCLAPTDEISSCQALLRSNGYRVFLIGLVCLTLLGNVGSFVYRTLLDKSSAKLGFNMFVTHLCVADFLMGVYLAIIGAADSWYQGTYAWSDVAWKHSGACKFAGFLSLLSCEVSAFIVFLITLDRFLVLRFPFSHVHFRPRSAHVACLVTWVVATCVAVVPLLPFTSHWQLYDQTGLCVPLPVARGLSSNSVYSFAVLIVLNFVLCLLIAVGQVFIYLSVRANAMSMVSTRRSNDHNIARRLLTVAMSDFLCWFPVGCVGILASRGVPISGEISVALAILVLPLNSAINPSLYTLNILLERRRLVKEERLQKYIVEQQAKETETQVN